MGVSMENEFAIQQPGKESIQDRLRQLFKGRTLRRVAQDWGLPYSTLNNYFTKGAKPGLDVVETICNVEQVSLEWLITGKGEQPSLIASEPEADRLRTAWNVAYEYMNKTEADELLRILLSGGARRLIQLARHDASLEETFMTLSPDLKERAIDLVGAHVEAKKGASEGSEVTTGSSANVKRKQAV